MGEEKTITGTQLFICKTTDLVTGKEEWTEVKHVDNICLREKTTIPELEVNGPESGKLLVVGWGGTYGHILSAVQEIREAGTELSFAHFDYIMPLPRNTEEVFSKFDKILVCELNSGQFVNYLRGVLPQFTYNQHNKVQGQPFLVQDLVAAIKEQL